jgi:pimeloyl-ACP methyl ester carboxylesterase
MCRKSGPVLAALLVLAACGAKPGALATVSIGDDRLAYVEAGEGEPLILVHGGLQDYRVWAPVIARLRTRYRVIAYSRRNHFPNRQGAASDLSPADRDGRDLERFMDALGIARAHVVGHSAGAYAALTFAARTPHRLASLVVHEPPASNLLAADPGDAAVASAFAASFESVRAAFRQGRIEEAVASFADAVGGAGAWAARTPEQRAMMLANAGPMAGDRQNIPRPSFDCAAAGRIEVPTLVTRGERSPAFFLRITAALATCLPSAELRTIAGTSHSVPVENPVGFADAVAAFVERH